MATQLSQEDKVKITRLRVLIVEDIAVDRLVLKNSLEKIGIQNIQEAVQGVDGSHKSFGASEIGSPFHIILTDWKMPKKDGLALIRELRSERFRVRPYVIMLTSHAETSRVMEAKEAGIDDYIVKPLQLEVITKKILTALEKITI